MPRRCSVTGCRSNYRRQAGKYVSCYGFPSDPKTLKKWLDAIGRRHFLPNYDAAVCAKHFDESSFLSEDMYRGADGELKVFKFAKPKLKIEAVPSLFLERRVERGREIERTDGCGVNEGVTMPLSTLINGFHHKTGAVLHSCEVLEVGDGKTCMDFVEVEMKDPENEEKPLNLDGSFCDSLDLRITNCGSGKRNGCLTNETVIRDGDGECLNNCGTLCDVSRSNLIGNRGFEKCRCDSAINRKLVHHQLVRGETDPDSGRFVKKVRGCGGQNSQNPSDQAADAKLDGAGTAGIMIDDGGLRRRTERNREVAIVQKRGNTGTLCGVLRAEKDVMSKKENCGISGQDVGNSMATSGNRSDSGETNDQTHADPETDLCYADLGSEEKVNKIEINCGGIRSRDNDSSGIFCDEIGGEKNSENKDTTHGEVNGNLAEIGVPLSQNRPCDVSNNDSDAKVDRGKNRGCTRNITKMQKAIFVQGNGYLVLNGSSSQRGSAMTNDQDFTVGSNPGLVKSTKKVQSCADNISCKNDSDGNFGGVLENGSREVVGQEHRNLVLINGNLSPNDGMKSGEVVSVKNVNKIHRECGDISSKNEFLVSGFGVITKNGSRIIPGLEKGSLIVDANSCSNDDVGSGQVVSLKNLKKTKRDFGETCCGSGFGSGTQNERRAVPAQANLCPNDDVQSEQVVSMKNLKKTQRDFGETRSGSDFGAVAKNEGRAIQGQENGDLVLMDVNLVPNDDVQSEQLVSMKTLKKPLRDFGETRSGSGFGAVTKNEMKAIPAQENGNSVLMDANLVPNNDVQSEQVVSTKTLKKTQRDFGGSGFGAVTKNERRAIPGQENGNSVLMDANLVPSDGMESVREPEVKVGGQIRGSGKTGEDEGPSEVQEWEGCAVKEELFRGLGLVPRGVLHDSSVDRRHCVTGPRRNESNRPKTAVFYPPGTAMFDTERFIGEIQRRPAIYDVRSKVYSNRVAKLKYWHEVGQEMYKGWDALDQMERRTLVKELQIKWKSIRDHFMRQLKQNMNGEGPKKKKYVHFDQLQFLTANLGVKRPRFKPAKQEPEEEYMELTPELPEERHFSFMTTVGRPDYDEHEVPVAANLLPQQPEDLSYHPKDLSYHHHKELSYHKELEGDRMGNRMFLLSLLPIMERLPDHSNIRARLQMMEVLQTFVAHEDTSHRDYYNYHDEKQSCGDVSQQHSTASHSDSDT